MRRVDYLIVAENSSAGQKMYTKQRKRMLEELGYSVEPVSFSIPTVRITLGQTRSHRILLPSYNYSAK
jgi:hypothetical protein